MFLMTQSNLDEIVQCLDTLLPKPDLVLSFDKSFVDQLPDILRENFAVRADSDIAKIPALRKLFQILCQTARANGKFRDFRHCLRPQV